MDEVIPTRPAGSVGGSEYVIGHTADGHQGMELLRVFKRIAALLVAATTGIAAILYFTGFGFVVRTLPIVGPLTEPLFRQHLATVPGPESPDLRTQLVGCIVHEINDQPGARVALNVVSLEDGSKRLKTWPIRDGYVHS